MLLSTMLAKNAMRVGEDQKTENVTISPGLMTLYLIFAIVVFIIELILVIYALSKVFGQDYPNIIEKFVNILVAMFQPVIYIFIKSVPVCKGM